MPNDKTPNYYLLIQKQLKKQYAEMEKSELNALTREIVFAPDNYAAEIDGRAVPIAAVRESLANSIERSAEGEIAIPYSLDAEIADMIEKNNCETSSMNEYYRWITATAEIIRNMGDGEITEQDVEERNSFIAHSFDREAEILLCLSLYGNAPTPKNREKINMLQFKLARLREMRSIVRNTSTLVNTREITEEKRDKIRAYYHYCRDLLAQKANSSPNFNQKLKLYINDYSDEDFDEDLPFMDMDDLRTAVLEMMREAEGAAAGNYRTQNADEYGKGQPDKAEELNINGILSSVRQNEGR